MIAPLKSCRSSAVCLLLIALFNCSAAIGQYANSRFEMNPLVMGGGRVVSSPGSSYAAAYDETDANVNKLSGFEGFVDWYMNPHVSLEGKYQSLATSSKSSGRLTEKSGIFGLRDEVAIGRVSPFIGLGFGLGSYQYTGSAGNQGEYPFIIGLSGGSEVRIARAITVRGTYTFDRWIAQQNYHIMTSISPVTYATSRYAGQSSATVAIGVVYHFPLSRDCQTY